MEQKEWVEAEWGESDLGRRVKVYRITRTGRARLAYEARQWETFTTVVSRILLPT
jgi:PadR family transcriptional regulator, regulatory protein PadR